MSYIICCTNIRDGKLNGDKSDIFYPGITNMIYYIVATYLLT